MEQPTADYYNRLAPLYDAATAGKWMPNIVLETYLRSLARPNSRVLDIGSGTGQTIETITQTGMSNSIVGMDISDGMLELCRKKQPGAELLLGDLLNLGPKLPAGSFDVITCIGTFEFIKDSASFLQEVHRLLAPKGHLFFTYEPLIRFHNIQDAAEAKVTPGEAATNAGISADDFVAYRHHPHILDLELQAANLLKMIDVEFVAYWKNSEPIVYHLLVCGPSRR